MDRYLGVVQVLLAIFMIFSAWNMIDYAYKKSRTKDYWVMNPIMIIEYVFITRTESGKIGKWFWIFLCSVLLLVGTSIIDIIIIGK
jgi:hypothetical protein